MTGRPAAMRQPRPGISRTGTASAAIYADLRAEILALKRLPGTPLSESQVAMACGVSRTPVREAILRLASEGLVDVFPQSGTFVSRIPLAALPEAIVIRKALEEAATRLAAAHATPEHIAVLEEIVARQGKAERAGDQNAFHLADEQFHAALADAAGYPGMWTIAQQVKVNVDRYRRLTLPRTGRMTHARDEHRAILDAVAAHDAPRAVAAMTHHLDGLLLVMDDIRRLNPDYFDAPAG
ncbi:MAG TPA: GntR family transcriptional regulator [Reyranella sp.]|nr:GntR family transcriptional regulator [Reyranella sp.]